MVIRSIVNTTHGAHTTEGKSVKSSFFILALYLQARLEPARMETDPDTPGRCLALLANITLGLTSKNYSFRR